MVKKTEEQAIAGELLERLLPAFPGIDITVAHNKRWNRPCATFCWDGFAGLLPEERFHRLTCVLSEEFRHEHMRGMVWLELAPGETVEAFLKFPRSEDIDAREAAIQHGLSKGGFFDLLAKRLGKAPKRVCKGNFRATEEVIQRGTAIDVSAENAKLLFIRRGVYCDCQVLQGAQAAMAEGNAGAA